MTLEEKLNQIAEAGEKGTPDTVTHVEVQHDTWCPALKSHCLMDCTCTPVIKKMVPQ